MTAEDGTARTIVLTVTRLPAGGDTRLSSLAIGTLDLGFHADVTAYSAAVPFATAWVSVAAETADGTSTATIAGQDAEADRPGRQAALTVGANTLSVTVTATDGSTRTYTVTVTRTPASGDARLARLALSGVDLAFEPATTTYAGQRGLARRVGDGVGGGGGPARPGGGAFHGRRSGRRRRRGRAHRRRQRDHGDRDSGGTGRRAHTR